MGSSPGASAGGSGDPGAGVVPAREWGETVGLRYGYYSWQHMLATTTALGTSHGWTSTGNTVVGMSPTGDLSLSLADYTPEQVMRVDSDAEFFVSPAIIGNAALQQAQGVLLGAPIDTIKLDIWGRIGLIVGDSGATVNGLGLFNRSDPTVATGQIHMKSGGTNFESKILAGADVDTLIARDALVHKFSIELKIAAATCQFFIDDVSAGAAAAVAQDTWPLGAGLSSNLAANPDPDLVAMLLEFSA